MVCCSVAEKYMIMLMGDEGLCQVCEDTGSEDPISVNGNYFLELMQSYLAKESFLQVFNEFL